MPPPARETADVSSSAVVLVVDDAAVADALALLLTIAGHRPIVAPDFEEARHALLGAERTPDVIICDQRLAQSRSGLKTIEEIRGLAALPIPAIVLTGCGTWSAMPNNRARIDHCHRLSKPFDGDALLALVTAILKTGET